MMNLNINSFKVIKVKYKKNYIKMKKQYFRIIMLWVIIFIKVFCKKISWITNKKHKLNNFNFGINCKTHYLWKKLIIGTQSILGKIFIAILEDNSAIH